MARRINILHLARTRDKIKTSMLINRLQNHAEGKIELTPAQVQSIKILLAKSLPDLSTVEHQIDPNANTLNIRINHFNQ